MVVIEKGSPAEKEGNEDLKEGTENEKEKKEKEGSADEREGSADEREEKERDVSVVSSPIEEEKKEAEARVFNKKQFLHHIKDVPQSRLVF